jgi:exodeoxyribonuclease VII large subunit
MVVQKMLPQGLGVAQAALEQLKLQLQREGLFAASRKRKLPRLPRCVVVITSPTGAVIRDIVQVASRRFPPFHLLLVPARVQGPECPQQLLAALSKACAYAATAAPQHAVEVIILARGGGSSADLYGFNDAHVVRALAACPYPTVAAVGHESDVTLVDFVADVRAPTPSAAAELVFPSRSELLGQVQHSLRRASMALRRRLQRWRLQQRALRSELGDGKRQLYSAMQRVALLQRRLPQRLRSQLQQQRAMLRRRAQVLQRNHPQQRLALLRHRWSAATWQLQQQVRQQQLLRRQRLQQASAVQQRFAPWLATCRRRLEVLQARLQALSPLAILQRGYSIVLKPPGIAVRSAHAVQPGESLRVRVHEGQFAVRVE